MRKRFSNNRICSASPVDSTVYNKTRKVYFLGLVLAMPEHKEAIEALSRGEIHIKVSCKLKDWIDVSYYIKVKERFFRIEKSEISLAKAVGKDIYIKVNGEYIPYIL